jgi:cell division protein ZapA
VQINILNQTFNIQGGDDPAYMRKLASYVEEKMMDIRRVTNTVDSYRLAVLTALHIADELFSAQNEYQELDRFINKKSVEFVKILDQFTE